jgi:hypothetical protein
VPPMSTPMREGLLLGAMVYLL